MSTALNDARRYLLRRRLGVQRARPSTMRSAGAIAATAIALMGGCATEGGSTGTGPYRSPSSDLRDTVKAQRLSQEAAPLIATDPAKAEAKLCEALTADLYYGPAHNNLGVLYLKMDPPKLYEAASEFEWARKLMPGHPDPRVNLALTLERAGRTDDALDAYQTAMEVYPDYLPAIEGLAKLQIRAGKADDRTPHLLDEIAMRGETSQWRDWAQRQRRRPATAGSPNHAAPPAAPASSQPPATPAP